MVVRKGNAASARASSYVELACPRYRGQPAARQQMRNARSVIIQRGPLITGRILGGGRRGDA